MSLVRRIVLCVCALAPAAALAAGGHDRAGCAGCHGPGSPSNRTYLDARTGRPPSGTTAMCLGCHADTEKGGRGIRPISQHVSHPFGLAAVNPKVAKVPTELLRDGRFECVSCHDPHPSNRNYDYLRVDVGAKGQQMDAFCAVCHPIKADAAVASRARIFTSTDERGPANPQQK